MTWPVDRVLGARTADAEPVGEDVVLALADRRPGVREELLARAGFAVERGRVVDDEGDPIQDPFFGTAIAEEDAALLPERGVVVEAHPLSVAAVLGEDT